MPVCDICGRSFKTASGLERHKQQKHPVEAPAPVKIEEVAPAPELLTVKVRMPILGAGTSDNPMRAPFELSPYRPSDMSYLSVGELEVEVNVTEDELNELLSLPNVRRVE